MATLPRTIAGIGLGLALMVVVGCESKMMEAARLNRQAQLYVDRQRCEDAQRLLLKSFAADYENETSHLLMGRCYEVAGQTERALYQYRLAVRFAPGRDDCQLGLIVALERNGMTTEADEAANLFLKHKQDPPEVYFDIADSFKLRDMGRLQLLTLKYAVQAYPQDAQTLIAMADYYFDKGEEVEGVDYLIRAFKVAPTHPGLAHRLGKHGLRVEIPEPVLEVLPSIED